MLGHKATFVSRLYMGSLRPSLGGIDDFGPCEDLDVIQFGLFYCRYPKFCVQLYLHSCPLMVTLSEHDSARWVAC